MLSYNPTLFNAAASKLFIQGATEALEDSYIPLVATVTMSTNREEDYAHIGDSPAMDEFKGEVVFTPMSDKSHKIINKKYTAGAAISEDDWNDDQLGGFAQRISGMGQEGVLLPNYLLMQALIDGDVAGNTSYDGDEFFDNSHRALGKEGGTQDNIATGTGTTVAQIKTDLNVNIAGLRGFKLENGRYANRSIRRLAVVFPPAIRETMLEAIEAAVISQTTNVSLRGISWTLIEDPQIEDDDANDYYLLNVGPSLRGLIWQQREVYRLIAEAANSSDNFVKELKRWKSKLRGRAGYGRWQHAMKITNA